MAKSLSDDVLDGALNIIKNNCTRITLCSAQPTTYTEGNATYALADVTVDSSDFTNANGDTSGRKLTVAQQTGINVDITATANHVAFLDVSGTRLLAVSTITSQALTSGNTATLNAFDIEIADPT